jgi:hypothetical protein
MIKTHCRFYDDLEQVLGDRPNVHAWYTNEDKVATVDDSSIDDNKNLSDQESFVSSTEVEVIDSSSKGKTIDLYQDETEFNINSEVEKSTNGKEKRNRRDVIPKDSDFDSSDDELFYDKNKKDVSTSGSTNVSSLTGRNFDSDDADKSSDVSSDKLVSPVASVESPKKKKKLNTERKLISPIEAKDIQRRLLQTHKRQIHEKNQNCKLSGLVNSEINEKDFLMKSRESKSRMESLRHKQMMKIQDTRINLDKRRIEIDEKRYELEIDNSELNRQRIKAQTQLDEQKRLLVKLEMFKLRTSLKKENPEISEEYLDKHFPTV